MIRLQKNEEHFIAQCTLLISIMVNTYFKLFLNPNRFAIFLFSYLNSSTPSRFFENVFPIIHVARSNKHKRIISNHVFKQLIILTFIHLKRNRIRRLHTADIEMSTQQDYRK